MRFTIGRKIFSKSQAIKRKHRKPMKTLNGTRAEAPQMYETENDISLQRRSELSALMNQRLADAVDLQMQMKQAHWNVKGPSFIGLHELFDKVNADEAWPLHVP